MYSKYGQDSLLLSMFAVYFQEELRKERKWCNINLHRIIYVLLIALLYTYDLSMKCYQSLSLLTRNPPTHPKCHYEYYLCTLNNHYSYRSWSSQSDASHAARWSVTSGRPTWASSRQNTRRETLSTPSVSRGNSECMQWADCLFTQVAALPYQRHLGNLKNVLMFTFRCRYCCRRMLLGHVDLIEKLLNYAPLEKWTDGKYFSAFFLSKIYPSTWNMSHLGGADILGWAWAGGWAAKNWVFSWNCVTQVSIKTTST